MSGSDQKKIILFVSSLASFLVPYTVSSLNVALPAIGSQFSLDAVTLGWITTAYIFTASVLILPLGGLADIYGRKRVFLLGNILFAIGSLMAALSLSGSDLIISRIIQGLGGSMVFATSVAIVTVVFPPGERGRAIGIITATVYAGLSLGPVLGGFLTQHLGWPAIFLLNVPLALVVILLTLAGIPGEWKSESGCRYDRRGAVLYSLMLIAGIYGLTILPGLFGVFWMAAGLILAWFFVRWEKQQSMPLINISLFSQNHTFFFSNLAAMINYAVVFAIGFLVSLSFQYNRGIDPTTTGLILLSQPLIQTIVSPFAGHLSDIIQPRIIATVGMACTTGGLVILLLTISSATMPYVIVGLCVLGLGYGLFSSPNTNAIMSSVPVKFLGMASGMVSTMRSIGQLISMAIAMIVFALIMGTVQITPAVYGGLEQSVTVILWIFVILGVLGTGASYARGVLVCSETEESP